MATDTSPFRRCAATATTVAGLAPLSTLCARLLTTRSDGYHRAPEGGSPLSPPLLQHYY